MANWTVEIGSPATLTLDTNVSIESLDARKTVNGKGQVEFVELSITVSGRSVDPSAAVIWSDIEARLNEVKSTFVPVQVDIKRDGTSELLLTPGASFAGSPRVDSFETIKEAGTGTGHWGYRIGIYAKLPGNAYQGVEKIRTSIRVERNEQGEVVLKMWRATVKHKTAAQAVSTVKSLKPPDPRVTEAIERFPQDAEAEGVWIWSAKQKQEQAGLIDVIEEISVEGGDPHYIPDGQVSDTGDPIPPILHAAQGAAVTITIQGISRSYDPTVAPPSLHYTPSDTMVQTKRPGRPGKAVLDPTTGVYLLRWAEVWIYTGGGEPPEPDHGQHFQKELKTEPPDGAIGGL